MMHNAIPLTTCYGLITTPVFYEIVSKRQWASNDQGALIALLAGFNVSKARKWQKMHSRLSMCTSLS